MCTVSFCKSKGNIICTSNRDENLSRVPAKPPQQFTINNNSLYFPIDSQGGGTWFCANKRGEIVILLNGAKIKHTANPPYRKSRGAIVIELFLNNDLLNNWHAINLEAIEPFTIVCYTLMGLYQCQWDGSSKSLVKLNEDEAYIWSSATLYSAAIKKQREQWFLNFLMEHNKAISQDKLWDFHTKTQLNDLENGLLIDRKDIHIKTRSITQCVLNDTFIEFKYLDTVTQQEFKQCYPRN